MPEDPSRKKMTQKTPPLEKKNVQERPLKTDLEKRARAILASDPLKGGDYSKKNVDYLISELHVHQVELDLQNEELRQSYQRLEQSRDRLASFFQNAPAGYLILDRVGMIRDANQTFARMVGKSLPELINKPFTRLVDPADTAVFNSRYTAFFNRPDGKSIELRLAGSKNTLFAARLDGRFLAIEETTPDRSDPQLFIVVTDITRQKAAEAQEQHTRKVLRAIRDITRLIVTETDPLRLIDLACSHLTRHMGYHGAWIALTHGPKNRVFLSAGSGFDGEFPSMADQLADGPPPPCMETALDQPDILVISDPVQECRACPFHEKYAGCAAYIQRLEHGGKIFGLLSVSVHRNYTGFAGEQALFAEVARELAFALNGIEVNRALGQAADIIERSPAVAFVWKNAAGWPVEYVSRNCESLFGRTARQFLENGLSYRDIIHPDDRDRVSQEVAAAGTAAGAGTITHRPYRIIRPDNTTRWIRDITYTRTDRSGTITHYEGIVLDVSEQKYTEDLVAKFFELPMNLHLVASLDGRILKANRGWHTILGYPDSELVNTRFLDLVHPDDRKTTSEKMAGLARGEHTFYFENRYRHKDGTFRTLAWSASTPSTDDRIFAVASDITEQKKAQQSLHKALQEQAAVFDTAMVGIMVLYDRIIFSVNQRMADILGYRPEEMINRGPEQLHLSHDHFVEFGEKYYWRLAEKTIVQVEYPLRHKSGRTVRCQFNGRAIAPPDLSKGAVWIIDDITDRKKMEKQLLQSKKTESLSRMAGAIAHHFNNILMATIGNLELAREDLPPDLPATGNIAQAEMSARRAASLSQLMLTCLGVDSRKTGVIDLSGLCRDKAAGWAGQCPETVTLRVDITAEALPVWADAAQLTRLLDSLWENAVEALADRDQGEITISTDRICGPDITSFHQFPNDFRPADRPYARVTVADTGRGIEEEKMDLIFDPFYSDKFTGRGLGLAVVLGIVKAHDGCILLDSRPGEWTRFDLFFPFAATPVNRAQVRPCQL